MIIKRESVHTSTINDLNLLNNLVYNAYYNGG